MTEKSTAAAPTPGQKITVQPAPQVNTDSIAEQKPNQGSQPALDTTRQPAVPVASENIAASSHVKAIYVVKSGDTLTRIAKVHGTTINALKAANHLNNDRIVVGAKLKIPEA